MKHKDIKNFYEEFHLNETTDPLSEFVQTERCSYLRSILKNIKGKVLVIGCGSQEDMGIINRDCDGVGIDVSKEAIKKSQYKYPQFKYLVADAIDLPFPENSFDCVVCSEVIEHILEQEKLLCVVKRILKNNGIFVVTTPNWFSWYGLARLLAEKILRKPFTAAEQPIDNWTNPWKLKKMLINYGFEIKLFRGFWYFPPTGRGMKQIPWRITFPVVKLFYLFEIISRRYFPWFGHSILYKAKVVK